MDSESDQSGVFREELARNFRDLELYRMPFGKYKHRQIHHLPLEYLAWFPEKQGGWPGGRLGELMEFVYHLKFTGAEAVLKQLDRNRRGPGSPEA